jgi:protein O-mannosyl-transferase
MSSLQQTSVVEFPPPSWRRDWLFGLFIFAVTMIAYQPLWHAGFAWDDDTYITNNLTLHSLKGLWYVWFVPGATVQYYPLTFTTFWIEYHLWGLNPLGYHLINVSLHAGNAILLWLILRKLGVRGAWLAAAIFALHPVCVESVAWVTERKNTLSGLFFLGSILVALKFWLPGETSPESRMAGRDKDSTASFGNRKFYWLAFVLYVCALCSKTTTLPLPVVILLVVWWKRGRLFWRDIYPLGLFMAAGVAMGLITMHVEKALGAAGNLWRFSWLERCLIASRDVWFYLGKLFWPHPLIFVYPRWTIDASEWTAYVPVLALVAGFSIFWWKRAGWGRPALFVAAYFLILLFLVLGFFNVYYFRYSFVADHFQYLASLGPFALAAAAITAALGFFQKWKSILAPVLCGMLLLTLGALTRQQCKMYANLETLWQTTIEQNPACWLAYNNLGSILLGRGQTNEAFALFQKALEVQPDYEIAHNSLGDVYFQKGLMDEAIAEFRKAVEIQPDYLKAYDSLGRALAQKGLLDEAMVQFRKALEFQPDNPIANNYLGIVLLQKGRVDEAAVHLQHAVQIDHHYAEAYNNLGFALLQKGRLDEAVAQFQKALDIKPTMAEGYNYLRDMAWTLATSPKASERNGVKAVEFAEQAARLSGGKDPAITMTLAAAYAEAGRFPEAVAAAKRTVQLAAAKNSPELDTALQAQLKLYQAGSPFRDAD